MTAVVPNTRGTSRVPPHNLEAEESVLGAVMLSIDAANEVMDRLTPGDFYVPAHRQIFESIVQLYNENQPIDAITVADSLRRREELERIGGVSFLTELMDRVPTASNVDYYAQIVEEDSLRRGMIRAGSTVADLATNTDESIAEVIDRAETEVMRIAERRVGDGLLPLSPLLASTLEDIEERAAHGGEITGLSTGFRDLDRKLAGLQRSNLVVVAARPAMGKCLAGSTQVIDPKTGARCSIEELVHSRDGSAHVLSLDETTKKLTVAAPTDFIDNGTQETYRVRTRLGHQVVATANHPFLTAAGWKRLDELGAREAIAAPRHLDVFGVDSLPDHEVALLAYLIGDGSVVGTTPVFSTSDERIRTDVAAFAAEMGVELRTSNPARSAPTYRLVWAERVTHAHIAEALGMAEGTISTAMSSGRDRLSARTVARVHEMAVAMGYRGTKNPVQEMIEHHGLAGSDASAKFVPEAVFRLAESQVALFLNRLYATDGSAWVSGEYYRIEYKTVSERLARDVQHLLLRFGVVAKLVERRIRYQGGRRQAWTVQFQDPESVLAFASRVGIFSKEAALAAVVEKARSRATNQSAWSLLPIEVWDLVLAEKGTRSWAEVSESTGRPRNHNWHVHTRRLSRRLLAELAAALRSDRLAALAASDVVWDEVVSIEPAGKCRTFDLEVPVHHNFVADDLIVHNSSLALNIAYNAAAHSEPAAVFSLEMSRDEMVQRLLCSVGRVDSMKLRSGDLGPLWQKVVDAASRLYNLPLYLDDSPDLTVTDIRAKCRRLKRQHGLSLVVVDYLQLMQGTRRENRQQEIAEISRSLKNLARELDLPVIAVSQLNRSLEAREDKRPRLGDLRESGAIEQDSDVVMFIYRNEYYHPEDIESKGLAEVIVAKHRSGATGRIDMTYLPEFTLFADLGRDQG